MLDRFTVVYQIVLGSTLGGFSGYLFYQNSSDGAAPPLRDRLSSILFQFLVE